MTVAVTADIWLSEARSPAAEAPRDMFGVVSKLPRAHTVVDARAPPSSDVGRDQL